MKRIMIFGLMALGFIALVMAIGEGNTITQVQLDSIDANTFDLKCQLEDVGQNHIVKHADNWYYFRNVSCLNIQPIKIDENTREYLIIRPSHYPNFLISDYFSCRRNNNAQYCNDFYTNDLREDHRFKKSEIRKRIKRFQTVQGDNENTDYEDGFGV